MKIKNLLILLALFFTLGLTNVKANTINSIDVNMYLNKDGSADVEEVWDVVGTDGTEWYHPFRDLGEVKITDYTVEMDNTPLTYKIWNVSESLSQKRGYYGINYPGNGIELCFGKYDYNHHTFKLKYHVEKIIFNVNDAQVLYWTFFSKFQNVDFKKFSVNIKSYFQFSDSLDVWGYGNKGYAYVKDGIISASNTEDSTMNGQYVVLLVKFDKEIFDTTHSTSKFQSFSDVLNAANEGTFEYDYKIKVSLWQKILNILRGLIVFIPMIVITIVSVILAKKNGYGYRNNKIIDKKNVPNFRDIPCNKDIYYANALIFLNNFGFKETNILGAIILKWVKQEKVGFIKQDTGIFKKEQNCLDLRKQPTFDNKLEEKLFNLMYEASIDGILEPKEFSRWARRNYDSFFGVFKSIKNDEVSKLRSTGHIYTRKNKEECKKHNVLDDQIYEDSKQLYGLKKFLDEFSSINEKGTLEVHIWEEYLMFAYLFGIADQVAKQLKNLYPELLEQNQNMDYTTIMMINHFSTTTVNAASSARSAAEHYSSGGGGFSSGGGGGGSFGGGGFSGGGSR